jgi:hypothetical protein
MHLPVRTLNRLFKAGRLILPVLLTLFVVLSGTLHGFSPDCIDDGPALLPAHPAMISATTHSPAPALATPAERGKKVTATATATTIDGTDGFSGSGGLGTHATVHAMCFGCALPVTSAIAFAALRHDPWHLPSATAHTFEPAALLRPPRAT